MNRISFILTFLFYMSSSAQDTLLPVIFLDDVIISEENNGFSIEDFIGYVKKDTTFYMGFKHLRYYSHKYKSALEIFDKKGKIKASLNKEGEYYSNQEKAWIAKDSTTSSGRIFKRNGKYRFYTPEAFDEVFFPGDTIDVSLKISNEKQHDDSQNMRDAKTVGFSIGSEDTEQSKGGMRKKLAVFSIDMQKYYKYIISDTIYKGIDCYVFTIRIDEQISEKEKEKALIRNLVSFFDKRNFNVIYREYHFVYDHWLIELDINIIVYMDYVKSKHVPIEIYYKGFWDAILFKPERAQFSLRNWDYIID